MICPGVQRKLRRLQRPFWGLGTCRETRFELERARWFFEFFQFQPPTRNRMARSSAACHANVRAARPEYERGEEPPPPRQLVSKRKSIRLHGVHRCATTVLRTW